MILQIVKFKSALSYEDVKRTAQEREKEFKKVPGLQKKYYIRSEELGIYGGVYLWDSLESVQAFRDTDLSAGMAEAYQLQGPPEIEIFEVANIAEV